MMPQISDLIALVASNIWIYGGSFLLVLGILVFVHEFGHYIVARWCGVRIETFSIGFGSEIWGFNDRRGTRWKFSIMPLGGYVKMFGDTDPASAGHDENISETDRNVAFYAKSVWKRIAIVFAGPGINYVFAVVVLAALYMVHGQPVTPPQAAAIIVGSPADHGGFQPQDVILNIGGDGIDRFEDIRREIAVRLDVPTHFSILRDGHKITLNVRPERKEETDQHGFKQTRGFLGIISPGNGIDLRFINAVDGRKVKDENQARALLLARMGHPVTIGLSKGLAKEIRIRPLMKQNEGLKDPKSKDYNAIIIADGQSQKIIQHGPVDAVGAAVRQTYVITASTLEAIGQMFVGERSAQELGGIIRIGAIAGDMAKSGMVALITFAALLSINLGLINLFPIPMLDGGHLAFYAAEIVRGKPLSDRVQEYAFRFGLVILVGIMVFANLNDILQLVLHRAN